MKEILSSYTISKRTAALVPVKHPDSLTLVIEIDTMFYVTKSPLTLIKEGCLQGYSSYEGRLESVKYYTGYQRKVPIPINPKQNIFAFPSLSPDAFECSWLFPAHIKSISPAKSEDMTIQSLVTLKNGKTIYMSESSAVLKKQMQRTAYFSMMYFADSV
ncbi:competence protein ComK [Bacillus salacetis]|uniref:competence protein ComK n=1 Tax=Bacillus salacetis TaxID=2315464 RepID=UPI003BA202CA